MNDLNNYEKLDTWIEQNFDDQIKFLQKLVRIPTDTPPGNNAPHADKTAELLKNFGFEVEKHQVPEAEVKNYGMETITNLIVRRNYGNDKKGKTIALNAHGDVVPPGEGWSFGPYEATIKDNQMYGRATAVSKSDFSTFTFAVRALENVIKPNQGNIELHFTYDEEFGGELGPGWLLKNNLTKPDLMIAAGFSYEVVTAHNGCLQLEVIVNGKMAHAAIPDSGVDALQGTTTILNALYSENLKYKNILSKVEGIKSPYLNVGKIEGGTNTNVIPGKIVLKVDRRMIPEENPEEVEKNIRELIVNAIDKFNSENYTNSEDKLTIEIKRILLARAMTPLAGNKELVETVQKHGEQVLGIKPKAVGTPLYTDVRLYAEKGIPGIIYGAGPRTVLESHAKRSDERINLDDLKKATKVIARSLYDLLK